jgi:flagellar biogenesis protein FliO
VANIASLISLFILLGGLAVAAVILHRYRDKIALRAMQGPMTIKGVTALGDGARLVLIEVDGVSVLCGVGRTGVTALTPLRHVQEGTASQ